jgi:hypothetical protein
MLRLYARVLNQKKRKPPGHALFIVEDPRFLQFG